MNYLHEHVFLDTEIARELFHETAKGLPIIDFHNHLPEQEILTDHRFENLWELWLKHDHYKWRLMRACGVDENYITGTASPWEKFAAFASIMPMALGNPVHHWAHLELQRVFGISHILNAENAKVIWDEANAQLQQNNTLSVRGMLKHFNIEILCTTDDPLSDLAAHASINKQQNDFKVFPTFRPDRFLTDESQSEEEVIEVLRDRHAFFHEHGCRLSDHGLAQMPVSNSRAFRILTKIAQWNTEKDWTMQLHLGPQRNVNSPMHEMLGADSGFDTMGSLPQTAALIEALNTFSENNILHRTIVYNLNPNESAAICCALQNFQNSKARGLLQYGPAWWHLDHVRGIREQLDILTSLGAIGTSVGMLTDSRSFTSFVRHEYYRRLLCQYIGKAAENGEMPSDIQTLKPLIADICYHNPKQYFNWAI